MLICNMLGSWCNDGNQILLIPMTSKVMIALYVFIINIMFICSSSYNFNVIIQCCYILFIIGR